MCYTNRLLLLLLLLLLLNHTTPNKGALAGGAKVDQVQDINGQFI